jgi:hypothetical protein
MIGKITNTNEKLLEIELISEPHHNKPKIGDVLEIRTPRQNRKMTQNNLYWLFCEYVGRELCMEAEEIHEGFKQANLKMTKVIKDKFFYTTESTSNLTTKEFGEYMERCNRTAIEFGVETASFWVQYEEITKKWEV